jgi:hypothetical protein
MIICIIDVFLITVIFLYLATFKQSLSKVDRKLSLLSCLPQFPLLGLG